MLSSNRRDFLKHVAAGALAAASAGCASRRADRPNIIFITADTTRFDRMGFNGYTQNATSPFLDAIAAQGVTFSQCHTQSGTTFPSAASFMTSKHPHTLGIHGNLGVEDHIGPDTPVLADMLREFGYTTVGASSVLWLGPRNGFDKGFDLFSYEAENDAVQRDSVETLACAKRMLGEVPRNAPLFLWFHSFDPHTPYNHKNIFGSAPTGVWPEPGERGVLLDTVAEGHQAITQDMVFFEGYEGFATREHVAKLNQLYDSQIAYMDGIIEDLFAFLRRAGFYHPDRDLVIFNSDHGELMGEHGFCPVHGRLWHEIAHTPLFMTGAGLPSGKSVDQLVANLDIVPTILELIAPDEARAVAKRHAFEGYSMLPAINRDYPIRDRVLTDVPYYSAIGSFDGRYKVVVRRAAEPGGGLEKHGAWALSGSVHFEDSQGIFRFELPEEVFAGHKALDLEFTMRSVSFGGEKTVSAPLTRPVFDLVTLHTQDDWDTIWVPWGPREWKLVLKDQSGKVVYDSEAEHGWVAFEPMPSRDYDLEVYDHRHDPGELTNVADDTPEELLHEWLEDILDEFEENTGTAYRNVVLEETRLKDFSDDELEQIQQLGYL